jgi:hypothetical protein
LFRPSQVTSRGTPPPAAPLDRGVDGDGADIVTRSRVAGEDQIAPGIVRSNAAGPALGRLGTGGVATRSILAAAPAGGDLQSRARLLVFDRSCRGVSNHSPIEPAGQADPHVSQLTDGRIRRRARLKSRPRLQSTAKHVPEVGTTSSARAAAGVRGGLRATARPPAARPT